MRAEWLRHGTDWGLVESNHEFRELDYVSFQMNTVFSFIQLFNRLVSSILIRRVRALSQSMLVS
jgi:hypothetical protein